MASFNEALEGVARGEVWVITEHLEDGANWCLQKIWDITTESWKIYYGQYEGGRMKMSPYTPSVNDLEKDWTRVDY